MPFPIFKVVGTSTTNTLSKLKLTIDNPLTTQTTGLPNIYTCVMNNFADVLSIHDTTFIFNSINYNNNIDVIFTKNVSSGYTNVIPTISKYIPKLPNTTNENFTNIISKKNYNIYDSNKVDSKLKLIETLTGGGSEIHIYTLQLDMSKTISTIRKNINIKLTFNNYQLIEIINLEILLGSANINGTTFCISCVGNNINTPNISIKNIRLVGTMTTNVFFSKKIPGVHVYYSSNTLDASNVDNNGWSTSIRLIESNGQFTIPENLGNVTGSGTGLGSGLGSDSGSASSDNSGSASSAETSNSSGSYMVLIIIILIILAIIGGGVYFFMKKKK
jgi:hypothetical protein